MSDYLLFNLKHFGMLFVMQEAIINAKNMVGLTQILDAVRISHPFSDIYELWVKQSVWDGGWSFLKVRHVRNISYAIVSISLASWVVAFFSRQKRNSGVLKNEASFLCFVLFLLTSLTVSWHYIQCVIIWGPEGASSNAWYLGLSLPFFLLFVFDSASRWSVKVGKIVALTLVLLYLYTDIRGCISMISCYSGEKTGLTALVNLASIRPAPLGVSTLLGASVGYLFGTSLLIRKAIRAWPPVAVRR